MTYLRDAVIAKAFTQVSAPKAPEKVLDDADNSTKIDYSNPSMCPYCQKPMVRSSVRTMSGNIEPVFLCPEHRAVGAVPDSMIDTEV
jgi:hypothetical protein